MVRFIGSRPVEVRSIPSQAPTGRAGEEGTGKPGNWMHFVS